MISVFIFIKLVTCIIGSRRVSYLAHWPCHFTGHSPGLLGPSPIQLRVIYLMCNDLCFHIYQIGYMYHWVPQGFIFGPLTMPLHWTQSRTAWTISYSIKSNLFDVAMISVFIFIKLVTCIIGSRRVSYLAHWPCHFTGHSPGLLGPSPIQLRVIYLMCSDHCLHTHLLTLTPEVFWLGTFLNPPVRSHKY